MAAETPVTNRRTLLKTSGALAGLGLLSTAGAADQNGTAGSASLPRHTRITIVSMSEARWTPGSAGGTIRTVYASEQGWISDGPSTQNGADWMKVWFADGTLGWVPASTLTQLPTSKIRDGDLVTVVEQEATVYASRSRTAETVGSVEHRHYGRAISDRVGSTDDGWYEIVFQNDVRGWVPETAVKLA